jgi:hypothetical protein
MTGFGIEILAALCFAAALILVIAALRPRAPTKIGYASRGWRRSDGNRDPARDTSAKERSPAPLVSHSAVADLTDVGVQLNAIMKATFKKRRVMNRSEYEVFKIVENEVALAKKGHRAFAQTSLGQVLESPSSDAFRSINAKRVDILVVDGGGWPAFAVEYQGKGHYQGTAAARDAIKKEALRRAGVGYLEVTPSDDEEQLRMRIREHLGVKASGVNVQSETRPFRTAPQLH